MKTLLTLIAIILPLVTFSQVRQGMSFLSGNLGYSASGEKDPDQSAPTSVTRQYSLAASYGFMFGDRWAIGIGPSYQGNSQATTGSKNYFRSFSITPFIRRYIAVGNKFYIFLDAGVTPTSTKNWSVLNGEKSPTNKSHSVTYSLIPGASFFITDHVALQASIGGISYGTSKTDASSKKSWTFGSNFGFNSLIIGAAVYF